jgi:hypothetical protein
MIIALILLRNTLNDINKVPKEKRKRDPLWSIGSIQLIGASIMTFIIGLSLLIRGNLKIF